MRENNVGFKKILLYVYIMIQKLVHISSCIRAVWYKAYRFVNMVIELYDQDKNLIALDEEVLFYKE
jgi:hypothetical protein